MDGLLVNPVTKGQLAHIAKKPPHAVLLTGPAGSGKQTLAVQTGATLLGIDAVKLEKYPYYRFIEPQKGTIAIELIRQLQRFLQLRTPGRAAVRRVIIVTSVETLTIEGQNAFLKTLEEPPADTVVILTAATLETVLPTIQSRATVVRVLPVSASQAHDYYTQRGFSTAAIKQAWALSQGQVGLLDALLNEADEHELMSAVSEAKQLLASTPYERLAHVDNYTKDKQALELLLAALSRIAQTALEQAALQHKTTATKRWHAMAEHLNHTRSAMQRNANTKLLLTDLMLNL